jgi:hypothetical protein
LPPEISTARSTIATLLSRGAGWFVALSWLLLVLAACAAFMLFFGASAWARVHPQHEDIGIITGQIYFALVATAIGLFAALASSGAILRGRRMAASVYVLACWGALLAGGTLYLGLIPRGPQFFDKYASSQRFHVPWQYYPRGADSPNRSGFSVYLCLGSLRGIYDHACRHGSEVIIRSGENGFDTWDEEIWQWRYRLGQMVLASTSEQGGFRMTAGPEAAYYRRSDADGNLNCLVVCKSGACRRQTLAGKIVIDYPLPKPDELERSSPPAQTDFSKWDDVDLKLVALVNAWAVR